MQLAKKNKITFSDQKLNVFGDCCQKENWKRNVRFNNQVRV